MDDAAADVHLHVDVNRASLVPAGIDGGKPGEALRIGALPAAEEGSTRRSAAEARVEPGGVAVPDLDERVPDGLAGRGVDDGRAQVEPHALVAVPDVSPKPAVRDVVGALGLLRREDARDETGCHSGRTDARGIGLVGSGYLPAEAGGKEAAEAEE